MTVASLYRLSTRCAALSEHASESAISFSKLCQTLAADEQSAASVCGSGLILPTRSSTTLADLFTLRARADPFSAVGASLRWRSGDERHDGVTDGRQAWSRRRSVDSFFPASLV